MIASVISAGAPLSRIVWPPPPFEHNHRSSSHTQFGGCAGSSCLHSGVDRAALAITAAIHGRTNHPAIIVVDSDEALVKKVEPTPCTVGLVDVYSITGGVNVLRASGKLRLQPGYPLHGN